MRRKLFVTSYYARHRQRMIDGQYLYKRDARMRILRHYSQSPEPYCACCGEKAYEFLTIDHIGGGGAKHRRELGGKGGNVFALWLIRNNYPAGFRVLCMNCNSALGFHGYCPHHPELKTDVRKENSPPPPPLSKGLWD